MHLHLQPLIIAGRTFLQPAVCDGDACLIRGAFALPEEVAGYQRGHAYGSFDGCEVQDTCNMQEHLTSSDNIPDTTHCAADGVHQCCDGLQMSDNYMVALILLPRLIYGQPMRHSVNFCCMRRPRENTDAATQTASKAEFVRTVD